ncbi:diacylglycerol/lipid kinase family protein, partial [Peribacillus acanthi]|uniref:diacylglycerol/lipid kinase family protein n=1 Tax=Peribacillus acanthi TaxID=2171554 RepID=UPI001F0BBCE1
MKKAMIIVNPSSGKEEAVTYKKEIEWILHKQCYEVVISMTEKEMDATKYCQDACNKEFDLVVSMGGDGTLNETINGLVGQNHLPTLAIIPMGTVNDFARALKIPLDAKRAIELLKNGEKRRVDVGSLNNRYFVNIVAIGAIAEATYEVSPKQKTKLGALAYVIESVKTLVTKEKYPLHIEHDHGKWEGEAFLFLAALTNSTGGFEKLSPHAKVDDGVLHCYIIKDVGWLSLASI